MQKKILTWLEADAALIRVAVSLIENMEQLSRSRFNYTALAELSSPQFDEAAFTAPIAADPISAPAYLAGISGFTDEAGNRRSLESFSGLPKACTWCFVAAVIQHLREARSNLESICYPQAKRKVKGPVLTRNK